MSLASIGSWRSPAEGSRHLHEVGRRQGSWRKSRPHHGSLERRDMVDPDFDRGMAWPLRNIGEGSLLLERTINIAAMHHAVVSLGNHIPPADRMQLGLVLKGRPVCGTVGK